MLKLYIYISVAVNVEFAFHPGKSAVCVANRARLPVNVAEGDAFIEHQRRRRRLSETRGKSDVSDLRAALEGKEHKRKSPG